MGLNLTCRLHYSVGDLLCGTTSQAKTQCAWAALIEMQKNLGGVISVSVLGG